MMDYTIHHQWPQPQEGVGIVNDSNMNKPATGVTSDNDNSSDRSNMKKATRPNKDRAPLNCPRCDSSNTKFCYYNNYSLSQPRYFCKSCRRYWTQGGTLRNVPVGGGSRKNRRPSLSSSLIPRTASSTKMFQPFPNQGSRSALHEPRDLTLCYPPHMPSLATTLPLGAHANTVSKGFSLMMMGHNFMQDLAFSSGAGFPAGSLLVDHFKTPTTSAASSSPLLNFSLARNINNDNSTDNAGFEVGGLSSFGLGLQEAGVGVGEESRVLFSRSVEDDLKPNMPSNNGTGDHCQSFEPNKGSSILGEGGDSGDAGFWNHGLLLSGSTPWGQHNQMQ